MSGKLGTLEGRGGGLGHLDVLLSDQVDGLVLCYLHTRAHVALPVQKEREGARQMLTAGEGRQKETFMVLMGSQEGNQSLGGQARTRLSCSEAHCLADNHMTEGSVTRQRIDNARNCLTDVLLLISIDKFITNKWCFNQNSSSKNRGLQKLF